MTNFVGGLWSTSNPSLPILLLGLDGAGKTTLLEQLKWIRLGNGLPLSTVVATVGFNLAKLPGDLAIWDLSGHESLRPLWSNYLASAGAFIFVIDSSETARAEEAVEVLSNLLSSPDTACKPFLIILNKSDLKWEGLDWPTLLLPLESSSEQHVSGFRVVTLSATTTPQLLDRAFTWLVGQVRKLA